MIYKEFMGMKLSEMGVGTYLGDLSPETSKRYEETIKLAFSRGINVVDTAINYRYMLSERAVGNALRELGREKLIVSTKGGYIPYDAQSGKDPREYFEETFIRTGLVEPSRMTPNGHYLGREFIDWSFETSLKNLRTSYVDVYFIHNPEEQLLYRDKEEFYETLGELFELLEKKVKEGKLRYYGLATWNAFRLTPASRQHISLPRVWEIARSVGGEGHHFRFIQLPYNLGMTEAFRLKNQELGGERLSTLETAKRLGIYVYTSATLYQGNVIGRVHPKLKEFFSTESDVHTAIQFVRSTPGVGTYLIGMSKPEHLEENVKVLEREPVREEEFLKLFE
ncbi:MAG: aldo/keto reductase [Aquificae bacterium]|nr:aldo/keto reductase [Aquificota bacterium]